MIYLRSLVYNVSRMVDQIIGLFSCVTPYFSHSITAVKRIWLYCSTVVLCDTWPETPKHVLWRNNSYKTSTMLCGKQFDQLFCTMKYGPLIETACDSVGRPESYAAISIVSDISIPKNFAVFLIHCNSSKTSTTSNQNNLSPRPLVSRTWF